MQGVALQLQGRLQQLLGGPDKVQVELHWEAFEWLAEQQGGSSQRRRPEDVRVLLPVVIDGRVGRCKVRWTVVWEA
jgi:hypothetical protein